MAKQSKRAQRTRTAALNAVRVQREYPAGLNGVYGHLRRATKYLATRTDEESARQFKLLSRHQKILERMIAADLSKRETHH
jgi:hypothetical protein